MLLLIIPLFLQALFSFLSKYTYWPEMLNYPFFISQGMIPYRDFSMVYTPLFPYLLTGVYSVFGFNGEVNHFVGTALLLCSNFVVGWFLYKTTGKPFLASGAMLLWGLVSIAFEGNHVWFDSFLTPLFLLIYYLEILYLKSRNKEHILLAGVLTALAILTKQTAVYAFIPFLVLFIYLSKNYKHEIIRLIFWYFLPILILGLTFVLILVVTGIWRDFVFWGIEFVMALRSFQGENLSPDLLVPSMRQSLLLIVLIFLGLVGVIRAKRVEVTLAFTWMLSTMLLAYPRWGYFHLESMTAFFVITVFLAFYYLKTRWKYIYLVTVAIIVVISSIKVYDWYLKTGDIFLDNEVIEIAKYINDNHPNDTIYSLNGPDLVYVLTGKIPTPLPWVDQLSWNMAWMGNRLTTIFLNNPPDLIIYRPYREGQYLPKLVFDYVIDKYSTTKYFKNYYILENIY